MSAMIIQFVDGRDYAKEIEYVPGPYHQDGDNDRKFQSAFLADAEAAGYTLEKALALRQKLNESKKDTK